MAVPRPPVACIDIDGVLADPTHRLHFLDERPKNWRGFFAHVDADPPLAPGVALVKELTSDGVTVIYMTGRPEYLRGATRDWLAALDLPHDVMHMRGRRDFRPAPHLKLAVCRQLLAEFDITTIVDDDENVVQHLLAAGLPVRRADWYRPPGDELTRAQDEEGRT